MMPKLSDFDFNQINFETDSMQVLSISQSEKDFIFPLTQSPINFSVLGSDGRLSNSWGVNTDSKGDAYVYRRDVPGAGKVSLHASGRQHISITSKMAERIGVDSRFGPVWSQPEFEQDTIATFSLLFPPWGIGISPKPSKSTRDELIIISDREKMVVVSFFIVDSTKEMRSQTPHLLLRQLLLQPGRTLHVIAWKEPQNDLMDRIREVFPEISMTITNLKLGKGDMTLCLQGFRGPNSAFMLTVPVHYTPPSKTRLP